MRRGALLMIDAMRRIAFYPEGTRANIFEVQQILDSWISEMETVREEHSRRRPQ